MMFNPTVPPLTLFNLPKKKNVLVPTAYMVANQMQQAIFQLFNPGDINTNYPPSVDKKLHTTTTGTSFLFFFLIGK